MILHARMIPCSLSSLLIATSCTSLLNLVARFFTFLIASFLTFLLEILRTQSLLFAPTSLPLLRCSLLAVSFYRLSRL